MDNIVVCVLREPLHKLAVPRRRPAASQNSAQSSSDDDWGAVAALAVLLRVAEWAGLFHHLSAILHLVYGVGNQLFGLLGRRHKALRPRLRTSPATGAKPRPCPPAPLKARMLVWKAMPSITLMISTILRELSSYFPLLPPLQLPQTAD